MISQAVWKTVITPAAIGSSRQIRYAPFVGSKLDLSFKSWHDISFEADSCTFRPVTTQHMTPADSQQILISQRKSRPTSPHLSIYRPQITWLASSLNRISAAIMSGSLYIFGTAYLAAPLLGWDLSSASMAAAFATWPVALKVATKLLIALPFTFHGFNGIRHLAWDAGKLLTNKVVIRTGWTVVGLSVVSSLALATMF